jgi:hypothetical protein
MANAISTATRYHISRASYYFGGPGSPANRKYPLLDFEGLDSVGPDVGAPWSVYANVYLGTPVAASATFVVNAQAVAAAGAVTLNTANELFQNKFANVTPLGSAGPGYVVTTDVERTLQYVSSNAGDTTQTITVYGFDQYNTPMTEAVALNGTTVVHGNKAFSYVWQVTSSAALAGNLSVGTDTKLGLPVAVDAGGFENAVTSTGSGNQTTDAGTFVFAFRGTSTATTGDVQGTYAPAAALNGTNAFWVRCFPAMGPNGKTSSTYGVAQF